MVLLQLELFLGYRFLVLYFYLSDSLLSWRFVDVPIGELSAATSDINVTTSLALISSWAYFVAGFRQQGIAFFCHYIEPAVFLLPINLLEDVTKPLSLSFRLFGNILADELTLGVLTALIPFFVPGPIMLLGLFTSGIQALVFTTLAGAYIGQSIRSH